MRLIALQDGIYRMYCFQLSADVFFFFKQKTAYEMRISDWSSDVCSSDLQPMNDASDAAGRPQADLLLNDTLILPEDSPSRRRHGGIQIAASVEFGPD